MKKLPVEAFDRAPRARVTLTRSTCWLERFDEQGYQSALYPVALREVAKAFNVFGLDTGLLPPDTLFWQCSHGRERVGLWLPPARRTMTFEGSKAKVINPPLPGFVFVGEGKKYFIWAAKERPSAPGAHLYLAPLPNVGSNGKICAGSVKFPTCSSKTIGEAAELFFGSLFNSDLSGGKVHGQGSSLFSFLHGLEKTFPLNKLIWSDVMLSDVMICTSKNVDHHGADGVIHLDPNEPLPEDVDLIDLMVHPVAYDADDDYGGWAEDWR